MNTFSFDDLLFSCYFCTNARDDSASLCFVPSDQTLTRIHADQIPHRQVVYGLLYYLDYYFEQFRDLFSLSPVLTGEAGLYELRITRNCLSSGELSRQLRGLSAA